MVSEKRSYQVDATEAAETNSMDDVDIGENNVLERVVVAGT